MHVPPPRFKKGDVVTCDNPCRNGRAFTGTIVVVDSWRVTQEYGYVPSYDIEGSFDDDDEVIWLKHVPDPEVRLVC